MGKSVAEVFPPRDWQAESAREVRKIWEDLRTDTDDPDIERRFRNRSLSADQAGLVFERWVLEAFRVSGMAGHYGFRVPLHASAQTREQIDGMVLEGWQGFLIEGKFWIGKVDFGLIALLHALLETRPVGTLGLFFSAFGYTPAAIESAELLRPIRVLLFDRRDLVWALEHRSFRRRMAAMVQRKWILALKLGRPHLPPDTTTELFNT
jgi:hypothetical protein